MKQITIQVPDDKFQFILELFRHLKFIKIASPVGKFIITGDQKVLVNEALRKIDENPGSALNWDEIKLQLKVD